MAAMTAYIYGVPAVAVAVAAEAGTGVSAAMGRQRRRLEQRGGGGGGVCGYEGRPAGPVPDSCSSGLSRLDSPDRGNLCRRHSSSRIARPTEMDAE